jgi:transposase
MSLRPQRPGPVPEETARVARAAFPKGSLSLRMRDDLGVLYEDSAFAPLFPVRGQPAIAPWQLALVTVMQYIERLSDRQAAEAVRGRLDWKYALGLDLTDPGFDYSVLSEFRARLVLGGLEEQVLDALVGLCRTRGWLKARGRQRTDSTHILSAARELNRLECVGETLRHTLNVLAEVAPDWLRRVAPPDWYERYGHRIEDYRLPKGQKARQEYAAVIGADGVQLLRALEAAEECAWLRDLPAVARLRQVWEQQYVAEADAAGPPASTPTSLRQRRAAELAPSGDRMDSPYDPDARFGRKRGTTWIGYKVHFTETCDSAAPHLIVQVDTTAAMIPDVARTAPIEDALARKALTPRQHLVDSGYVSAQELFTSRERHAIDLLGPMRADGKWQAKARQGYDLARFHLNWDEQRARCPQGKLSRYNWISHPTIRLDTRQFGWTPMLSPVDTSTACAPAPPGPQHAPAHLPAGMLG